MMYLHVYQQQCTSMSLFFGANDMRVVFYNAACRSSSAILSEVMHTVNTDWRSSQQYVRSNTPCHICLSGICIARPTRVQASVSDIFRFARYSMRHTCHVSSMPLRCQVMRCTFCVSCRGIDHPAKAKQERLMFFRRGRGVMQLCRYISMYSTS